MSRRFPRRSTKTDLELDAIKRQREQAEQKYAKALEKGPTCDWCANPATHITRHERRNTGTLIAYWCDVHYESEQANP